jgi:hypothetical protein
MQAHADAVLPGKERAGEPPWRQVLTRSAPDGAHVAEFGRCDIARDTQASSHKPEPVSGQESRRVSGSRFMSSLASWLLASIVAWRAARRAARMRHIQRFFDKGLSAIE